MSLNWFIVLLSALSLYTYFFIRRTAYIETVALPLFYDRIHSPKALKVLSEDEHKLIHDKLDTFHLRSLSCFIASIIAVASSVLFVALVSYGGTAHIAGYILATTFAYIFANYNMNYTFDGWMRSVENDVVARIVVTAVTNESIEDDEGVVVELLSNDEKRVLLGEEFYQALVARGFDPDKDYAESPEAQAEFAEIFIGATDEITEKYTETHEK